MYNISVTISTQPVNSTKCPGSIGVFNIKAQGNFRTVASQNVVWKRLRQPSNVYETLVQSNPKYVVITSVTAGFTILDSALRIINVTVDDEGWYLSEISDDSVMSNAVYLNVITATATGTLYNDTSLTPKYIFV